MDEDPIILKSNKQDRYFFNDESEDALMMENLMKKSTEMFGARRSVTALFMMRRSTKQSEDTPKSNLSKDEGKFSMLSQANKQPIKKDIEVVDITDDI